MTWLPKSVVCLRYYDRSRFRSDLFASSVLILQIFPACVAIAIGSGLSPVYGVSSAAIAIFVTSAFGDSKVRISAPSILLIAVASNIVERYGVVGLSLSTLVAGALLVFFGAIGLGTAIQVLPRPVIAGFFTGIAILVVTKQIPELLGSASQYSGIGAGWGLLTALRDCKQVVPAAVVFGLGSLVMILASRRAYRHIPAGLVTMAIGTLLVRFGHFSVRTVGVLYPSNPVMGLHLTLALRQDLLGSILSQAFALAVLVAVASLEAVDVASGHTGERVDPNGELVVEGGTNIAVAFAGGLPASGTSLYSSENALSGAQTPVAGILQSVILICFLFLVVPFLPFVPLPVISAVILSCVGSMTHWRALSQEVKLGWTEMSAWLAVSVFTIVDLAIGIAVGLLIGMLMHVRKQKSVRLSETR